MSMRHITWGIVGAGNIAARFCASLAHVRDCSLGAISGRHSAKLRAFIADNCLDQPGCGLVPSGGVRAYADDDPSCGEGGAAALVDDSAIDAIYLALPHGVHVEWATRALAAGRAVLCEKPAVLSAAEAERIAQVARANDTLFMEAMKCRFTPLHDEVASLIASGELGAIVSVSATQKFDYGDSCEGYLIDPTQGGTLYDCGCYAASWLEEFLPGDVELADARVRWREVAAGARVDWADNANLRIGGKPAHLICDGAAPFESLAVIECERGRVEVERLHRPERARVITSVGECVIDAPYKVDDFFGEIEHFCDLLRADQRESPIMPLAATSRNAQIIDAIRSGY